VVVILLAAIAGPVCAASPGDDPSQRRAEAIRLADQGSFDAALEILAALRVAAPGDRGLLYDQTVVLSWAEHDDEVLRNARDIDPELAPVHVLESVAKAARNLQRFDQAAAWYRRALDKQPDRLDAVLGLAMTLADAGQTTQAMRSLDRRAGKWAGHRRVRLARAYIHEQGRRFFDAIQEYDAVLARTPSDPEALRGKVYALRVLLLPMQALEIADRHPDLFSIEERAQLRADEIGLMIRQAIDTPAPDERRYVAIDAALDRLDARLAQGDIPQSVRRRLRFDRILALVERRRMPEAIAEYEALQAAGADIPAYVHAAAARAYIYEQQRESGYVAIQQALAQEPENIAFRMEQFYALAELDRYDEAIEVAERLVADLRVANRETDGELEEQLLRSRIMAIMGHAYADRLEHAQYRLERLLEELPGNVSAQENLGYVYMWRGWSDRAVAEFGQVLAVEPGSVDAAVGLGHALMDLQRYRESHNRLDHLNRYNADRSPVKELARRWQVHRLSELRIEAGVGRSSGDTFGSDQYQLDAWWYTRPMDWNYRAFVHSFDAWADFDFGSISRRRAGIGGEYRRGAWTAEVESSFDRSGLNDVGLSGRVDRRFSDTWSAGALLQFNSFETPLRGHRTGVDSNLAGIDVSYRRHESLRVFSGIRFQDFSDGNRRFAGFVDGHWRRITGPRYKLELTGGLAASSNSIGNVANYFNPDRDFEVMVGADNHWLAYHRYDERLVHRLHAQVGLYNQQSFGTDFIWSLHYEVIWTVSDTLNLRLGARRGRRVYDGRPEDQTFLMAGLEGRF